MTEYGGPEYAPRVPDLDNGGRWDHIASELEVRRALNGHGPTMTVYELPVIGKTFVINWRELTVVRLHAMGGGTREIEGGWVYVNPFSLMRDENEFKELAKLRRNR